MPKKKIEVVELNKKEEKIILEETSSAIILFWRKYRGLILSLLLALSLIIFSVSLFLFLKNIGKNDIPNISAVKIDTTLTDSIANIATDLALTDESAKESFVRGGIYVSRGEVLLVKKIENNNFTIKFFSDGTAIKIPKNGKRITRVFALPNGNYGINDNGVISSKAQTTEVVVTDTQKYPWGEVTYYSDNSAEVTNSKMDLFVRSSTDVKDNYISDNKVSYLKDTKNVGNVKLNYYYDGTIEVIKNNVSYLVRKESDLDITGSDVIFKNNNAAEIYKTIKTDRGETIDYYTDGGAIIRNGTNTLSVRRSNSIIIKNNNIFEIVDNIYVTESKKTPNATYYTNGGAVINYNRKVLYIPENSDITYNQGAINGIGSNAEELSKETNVGSTNVKNFTHTAVVTTPDFIAILPKDNVIYEKTGEIKELKDNSSSDDEDLITKFTITNNTGSVVSYRLLIEQSARTTVDTSYLRYQLQVKEKYIGPVKLNDQIMTSDEVSEMLNIKGINYILAEDKLEPYETAEISLMLWADYDTIPNSQMDKYFYGTIRVFAYQEK